MLLLLELLSELEKFFSLGQIAQLFPQAPHWAFVARPRL
jgi:hypothetical protein